jgi:hypothetical protein
MTRRPDDPRLPTRPVATPPGVPTIVAVSEAGRDGPNARVREAAASMAGPTGRVLLLHLPTAGAGSGGSARLFIPPMGIEPGASARQHTGSRRTDLLLEASASIRSLGVEVAVWIARRNGPAAIAEAVSATGASAVLVAAGPCCGPGIRGRIDRTLAYYAGRLAVPLLVVDRAGRTTAVSPLGGGSGEASRETGRRAAPPPARPAWLALGQGARAVR